MDIPILLGIASVSLLLSPIILPLIELLLPFESKIPTLLFPEIKFPFEAVPMVLLFISAKSIIIPTLLGKAEVPLMLVPILLSIIEIFDIGLED